MNFVQQNDIPRLKQHLFSHNKSQKEINSLLLKRDSLTGNTLLLQAVSDKNVEIVEILMNCGNGTSINTSDYESNYTPLHKAISHPCSLKIIFTLLNISHINLSIKDNEGFDCFDLFYASIKLNNNHKDDHHSVSMSLWSWGSNTNHLLGRGHGHADSRPDPAPVDLIKNPISSFPNLLETDVAIKAVEMSKYHAIVLVSQTVYVYGLGSGGRLGCGDESSKLGPVHVPRLLGIKCCAVAAGNDHSMALDARGAVHVWGWNRFGQVGVGSGLEKVLEPEELLCLKKVVVKGIAAAKYHSAAFSESGAIYTWGTNYGQLGYESSQIQPIPKKVIAFSPQPILQISATANATLILTSSNQIHVFHNHTIQKLTLPLPTAFLHTLNGESHSSRRPTNRLPVAVRMSRGSGAQVGIVLSNGDVCLWSPDTLCKISWKARKKHNVAIDCAVDSDGSLMVVTDRGHVYKGTPHPHPHRPPSSSPLVRASDATPTLKFAKMAGVEHVSEISASGAGCFAAVRSDYRRPPSDPMKGSDDVCSFIRNVSACMRGQGAVNGVGVDLVIVAARSVVVEDVLSQGRNGEGEGWMVDADGTQVWVYREDGGLVGSNAVMLVVEWMYCIRIRVPWTADFRLQKAGSGQDVELQRMYLDFKRLVSVLGLQVDESELDYPTDAVPDANDSNSRIPSVESTQTSDRVLPPSSEFLEKLNSLNQFCNVAVSTSDGLVECHQVVLSSRSGFFKCLFRGQWLQGFTKDNKKLVYLPQTTSALFRQLYRHLLRPCTDLFDVDFGEYGKDEWIELIKQFQILADELIVPRLVNMCSIVLGRFITLHNVFGILEHALDIGLSSVVMGYDGEVMQSISTDSTPKKKKKNPKLQYHSNHLSETCLDFIIRNFETFCKNRVLQKSPEVIVQAVQDRIQFLQAEKLPLMLGPGGYYAQLAALEEARRREQKEERRMMYAARGGENGLESSIKGKEMQRQFSDESFVTVNDSTQSMQLASPVLASYNSEFEDNLSPIILPQSPYNDPVDRLFKAEDRTTSSMSFSTAVLSPMLNADAGSDGVSPLMNHSSNMASSMEDFKLDGDDHWTESKPRRKNSSRRSSIDLCRKPPTGSPIFSSGSLDHSVAMSPSPRSFSALATPIAFITSKSAISSAEMSPFNARLSAVHLQDSSSRFLGSGLKLVRQLSTSVSKDVSSSVKSQLSAKFSPLKSTLSGSPVLAAQSSNIDTCYGIQIKSGTKLSQRERKRLSLQNSAPSLTTTKSAPSSAWGIPTVGRSNVSAASFKVSLGDIQQEQEAYRKESLTPPKPTRWSIPCEQTSQSPILATSLKTVSPFSSGNPKSPGFFATSPIVSLRNIQQQQTQAKLVLQKEKAKTIAQIQAEECAIQELNQFYRDTRGAGSGEWISLERKVRI